MTATSRSRTHMATKTCTIKRVDLNISTGATALPDGIIADIPCTPLMARNENQITAGRAQSPSMGDMILHELMIFGEYDIKKGDRLILDSVEYSIWDKHIWKVRDPFMLIVLSDVQAVQSSEAEFVR